MLPVSLPVSADTKRVYATSERLDNASFDHPDVDVEPVTEATVDGIADFRDESYIETFEDFLDRGDIGVLAVENEGVVGHAWAIVARDGENTAKGYFSIRENTALIHYCRVKESERGRGIYPSMLVDLTAELIGSEGLDRVFIETDTSNTASQHGIEKAGFSDLGRGQYISLLGRTVITREGFER